MSRNAKISPIKVWDEKLRRTGEGLPEEKKNKRKKQ